MTTDEENLTIGTFTVPSRGCSRSTRSPDWQSWSISAVPEGPEYGAFLRTADLAIDGDNTTCAETGGEGRRIGPTDDGPWWRTDLGGLVHVEGIWMAGDALKGVGAGARFVDVFVVEANVTSVSDLYQFPLLISGRWCNFQDGGPAIRLKEFYGYTLEKCKAVCAAHAQCQYISYKSQGGFCNTYKTCGVPEGKAGWDTYEREPSKARLCAENALVGSALEELSAPPLVVASCAKSLIGSHVWVFARDENRGLTLCEVEVYTTPLHVASQAMFQWGSPPNGSKSICGAQNATIEWSDDNQTWHQEWITNAEPRYAFVQNGSWEWWAQLFALNFTATFDKAGVLPLEIPSLRPNSTYDVFCWARDAIGNDISRELVTLLQPWGDAMNTATTDDGYEGPPLPWRRLEEVKEEGGRGSGIMLKEGGGLQCSDALRELIPCEERIVTQDRKPPAVVSFTLTKREAGSLDSNLVPTERAFVEMALSDTSCKNRQIRAVKCTARCQVKNMIDAPGDWEIELCEGTRCLDKRWSNEDKVQFAFSPLYEGVSYAVMCEMSDPWGNSHRERFELHLPVSSTTPAPSPVPSLTPQPWQQKEKEEKKEEKDESTSPTTTQPKSKWADWKPPPPSAEDDDDGWITIGDFTTTSTVRATPPPRTTTTRGTFTTSWLPVKQTTPPTTESTTTLPGATAPPPVQILLSLGATSEADANMLLRPSSISALVSALRQSLGLSADDAVVVQAAKILKPAGRRLNASSIQIWEVRLRIQMRMVGAVHAATVNTRLRELRDGTGNRRELVTQAFRSELRSRSVQIADTTVLGVTLQDGALGMAEEAAQSSGPASAGFETSNPGTGAGASDTGKAAISSSTMWFIIASLAFVLLCFVVPAGAVCAWWTCYKSGSNKADAGRRPVGIASSAKERRSSSGRRSRGSSGEQTSRPAALQKLPVQAPNPSHGPPSPCKIAWASAEEERVHTPSSSISTASTRHSGGQYASSSNASALPSTRTETPGSEPSSIVGDIPRVKPAARNSLDEEAVEVESCTSAVTSARASTAADPAETALVIAPDISMPAAMRDNAAAATASSRMGLMRQTEPVPAPPDTSGRGYRLPAGGAHLGQGSRAASHIAPVYGAAAAAVHWRGQAASPGPVYGAATRSSGSARGAAHRGVHRSSSRGRQGSATPPLLQ